MMGHLHGDTWQPIDLDQCIECIEKERSKPHLREEDRIGSDAYVEKLKKQFGGRQ